MSENLEQQLTAIKAYQPTVQQLLMACPLDKQNNLDGLLTEDFFEAKLFYCDSWLVGLQDELTRRLASLVETKRIIFLT